MKLDKFTDKELEAELAKRKKEKETPPLPLQRTRLDVSYLREVCRSYIEQIKAGREADKNHIVEEAMNCIYGNGVWKWINYRRNK